MRIAITAVSATAAVLVIPASAPASDSMACSFETRLSFDHGITATSDDAGFSSNVGELNCAGRAGGRTVIGVGTIRITGDAASAAAPNGGESCAVGAGYGTIDLEVPYLITSFAPESSAAQLAGNIEYKHAGPAWEALGSVSGPGGQSGVAIAATEQAHSGGCVTAPKRLSTLSGELLVGGEGAAQPSPAAGPCAKQVRGSAKNDRLAGSRADEMLSGFGGNDRVSARAGADCLFGGTGSDRLRGGPGRDAINCGPGADVVRAGKSDQVARNCERVV